MSSRNFFDPPTNTPQRLTDTERLTKCTQEGMIFEIRLSSSQKKVIRSAFGLVTDHEKNCTVRKNAAQPDSIIMGLLAKNKMFNKLSVLLFATHQATKILNHTLMLKICDYITTTYAMTMPQIVDSRYGICDKIPQGINLLNAALWALSKECVQCCIAHGCDFNYVNSYGETCTDILKLGLKQANTYMIESKLMNERRHRECHDYIIEVYEFNKELERVAKEEKSVPYKPNCVSSSSVSIAENPSPDTSVMDDSENLALGQTKKAERKAEKKAEKKANRNVVLNYSNSFDALQMGSGQKKEKKEKKEHVGESIVSDFSQSDDPIIDDGFSMSVSKKIKKKTRAVNLKHIDPDQVHDQQISSIDDISNGFRDIFQSSRSETEMNDRLASFKKGLCPELWAEFSKLNEGIL